MKNYINSCVFAVICLAANLITGNNSFQIGVFIFSAATLILLEMDKKK